MEAIDSLLSITSADISEIRLRMEVLLEVYLPTQKTPPMAVDECEEDNPPMPCA
jgi:hypothetical protein